MDLQTRFGNWTDRRQNSVAFLLVILLGIAGTIALVYLQPTGSERPADWFAHVLVWTSAATLLLYRKNPKLGLLIGTVLVLIQWVFDYPSDSGIVLWVLLYATTRHGGDDRRSVWRYVGASLAAATLVAIAGVIVSTEDLPAIAIVAIPILHGLFAVIGEALYQRCRYVEQLEQRASALENDLKNQAALAAVEERTRIAREMHDIIAHGMSTVVVQSQAGQRVLDDNPEKAREVLLTIENIGRSSVDEMRRMLGVLRNDEIETELVPQPGFDDMDDLRRQIEDAGVELEISVVGEHDHLPPGLELTGYRIVQEALTNVLRHAGRPVRVEASIHCGLDELTIEVVDDGLGAAALSGTAGTGHGLRGMAERVEIYDGTFTAGPAPGGGFSVSATLPVPARVSK